MSRLCVKCVVAVLAAVVGVRAVGAGAEERQAPRLEVLARTIVLLKDRYVDPARFEPRRMLVAALVRVSEEVDELVVEGDEGSEKLTLRMGGEARELALAPVTNLFALRPALVEALRFVAAHSNVEESKLESAAVNGLLSTLGPHDHLLPPEAAAEMKKQIRGDFAALGLVIGIRAEKLTLVKVLPDAPGQRIGLAKGDVITEIDGHSTAGRDLTQVVDWMRGAKDSEVTVVWTRAGGAPQRVRARRELINIRTLSAAALLPDQIAYARLSAFTARAHRELAQALRDVGRSAPAPIRGVILDLRDNPGGLLDAGAQVADLFLSQGDILELDPAAWGPMKRATADPSDVTQPVVVLVNHDSAGSSEIVAAALRENGRAIVIGQRTFGLGSFQQLQEVQDPTPETNPAMLKYTAGRYRLAGGRTFDRVGLVPDVVVRPGRVTRDAIHFFAPRALPPLAAAAAGEEPEPVGTLTYLLEEAGAVPPAPGVLEDEEERDPAHDPLVTFATQVLNRATSPDRDGLLAAAREVLPERQAAEQERLAKRVSALGIDWTKAPSDASPEVKVTLSPLPRTVTPSGPVPWTVTVENLGPGPLSRLRVWTVAPQAPHLDRLEALFGTLAAGAKRSATLLVPGTSVATGAEPVSLHFEEENGHAPADVAARFEVASITRPSLSARVKLTCAAKKCGPLDAGAEVKVDAVVRNSGAAPGGAQAALALSSADERVYATHARTAAGPVAPGAEKTAALGFRLVAGSGGDAIPVMLRFEQAGPDVTSCGLDLKRGDKLPLTRECQPVRLRLSPDPDAAAVVAGGDRLALAGTASIAGTERMKRVVIRVNDRKAFAQVASDEAKATLDFTASLPLQPGVNAVSVLVETTSGKTALRTFKVERR
jgi:carboxyl-terminal processing protease